MERFFKFKERGTDLRTEIVAGFTTFMTMAYIIFVQPAVLTGQATKTPTGMDFGAITAATCLSAALATAALTRPHLAAANVARISEERARLLKPGTSLLVRYRKQGS
jgi:xanthine/uracil/vitamin C permease (AzgA family)